MATNVSLDTIHLSRRNNINHLKCLIALANADGSLNEEAMGYLTMRMDKQGLKIEHFNLCCAELIQNKILPSPLEGFERIPVVSTNKMSEALECIQDYISLMASDGKIDANEKTIAYAIATKMGLNPSMIDFAIKIQQKKGDESLHVDVVNIDVEEILSKAAQKETDNKSHIKSSAEERDNLRQEKANKGELGGWLGFFLICTALGGVLTIFLNIYYADFSSSFSGLGWFFAGDFFMYLSHAGICFYVIDGFYRRRDNTVFWSKVALVSYLFTNIEMLFVNDFPNKWVNNVWGCIFGLAWGIIWFIYLNKSKQVARLIPIEKRAPRRRDLTVLAILASVSVICWCVGAITLSTDYKSSTDEAKPIVMTQNESLSDDSTLPFPFKHCYVDLPSSFKSVANEYNISFENESLDISGSIWEDYVSYPYITMKEKMDKEIYRFLVDGYKDLGTRISIIDRKAYLDWYYIRCKTDLDSQATKYCTLAAKSLGDVFFAWVVYYSYSLPEIGVNDPLGEIMNSIKPKQ